jgi:hypothetical protein
MANHLLTSHGALPGGHAGAVWAASRIRDRAARTRISPPSGDQACRRLESRHLNLAHAAAPGAGLSPPAAELRPTAATGAAVTEIGPDSAEPQVTLHAGPFIRKSSVWVKHSLIGPGRSSLRTDAAA